MTFLGSTPCSFEEGRSRNLTKMRAHLLNKGIDFPDRVLGLNILKPVKDPSSSMPSSLKISSTLKTSMYP